MSRLADAAVQDQIRFKPYGVSYSKMATFRRCLQQYHWKYVDKYYPPSTIGQARGTAGHAALASWHRDYVADDALQIAWDTWENNGYGQGDDWLLLETSLERYFTWSTEQQDTFRVVEAEQKFDITYEVPDGESFTLTGYIDGIVEEKGHTWLLENKFYKRMDNSPLDLDHQVSIYMLAATLLEYPVQGVIYNIVRVADTKIAVTEPAVRRRLHRNVEGLQRIEMEMVRQVAAMQAYEKKGGLPYRNPMSSCSWDCPFYGPCLSLQDNAVEPVELLQKISHTRSNDGEKSI